MARSSSSNVFDVIIVGGGPAGLFGAYYLAENSDLKVLVIDKGNSPLKRKCPIKENGCIKCKPCNILCGIGGAGLFSDGKLNFIHKLGKTDHRSAYIEFFILISLIPNLTNTDTEHFLWSIPVLAGLLVMMPWKTSRMWWLAIAVLALPWLLSTPDLIGRSASEWLDKSGLIGLSNTLLIVWFALWSLKPPQHTSPPPVHCAV
jgi:hypothetical protein